MNGRRGGTAWRSLRRRNPPKAPTHAEIEQAISRFEERGGIIRKLRAEVVGPQNTCIPHASTTYEDMRTYAGGANGAFASNLADGHNVSLLHGRKVSYG